MAVLEIQGATDMAPASPEPATPTPTTNSKLDDHTIVTQVVRLRSEAFDRDYIIRDKWLQCYQIYRNHADFSDKAPWQSRLLFSKGFSAVKTLTANILRLLMSSQQWLTVEPAEPGDIYKATAPIVEDVVLKLADSGSAHTTLRDALEFGACIGVGAVKVEWRYDIRNDLALEPGRDGSSGQPTDPVLQQKQRKEGHIALTSIDPFHLWFGPRSQGVRSFDYIIEESYADLVALKQQSGFLNLDTIHGDTPDQSTITQSYDQQRKDKRIMPETVRKQVHLLEYWGDLVDSKNNDL